MTHPQRRPPAPDFPSGEPAFLTAALDYADRGWPVFPLHTPHTLTGCSCGRGSACPNPGKHPRVPRGLHAATCSTWQINTWWTRWPDSNIGLATGRLVVLDVDGDAGRESLSALQAQHGKLPTTARVGTGRGEHHYFTAGGRGIHNSAGRLGDGLDVRGAGGYVIAPPSVHASGHHYRWLDQQHIAVIPDWLADLLLTPVTPLPRAPLPLPPRPAGGTRAERYTQAAIAAETAEVAMARPGTRNHTLNRAAFRLGQLVGAGLADAFAVTTALSDAATRAGLPETEARATIGSGLRAGRQHPRRFPTTFDGA